MDKIQQDKNNPPRKSTKERLLSAALSIISEDKNGIPGLSLREITRRIGISPTAFYRHFPGMEALGLELISEAGEMLRQMLHQARAAGAIDNMISASVKVYLRFVREHNSTFLMIARERAGSSEQMRNAIRKEMEFCSTELVTDIRLMNVFPKLNIASLQNIAAMGIGLAFSAIPEILDIPENNSQMEKEMTGKLEEQLRILFIGASNWQPGID